MGEKRNCVDDVSAIGTNASWNLICFVFYFGQIHLKYLDADKMRGKSIVRWLCWFFWFRCFSLIQMGEQKGRRVGWSEDHITVCHSIVTGWNWQGYDHKFFSVVFHNFLLRHWPRALLMRHLCKIFVSCNWIILDMSHRRHQNWYNMFCRLAQQPRTVPEIYLANTETRMVRNPIWKKCRIWNDKLVAEKWQIGGAAKSALAFFSIDLHRFWQSKSWCCHTALSKKVCKYGAKMQNEGSRSL